MKKSSGGWLLLAAACNLATAAEPAFTRVQPQEFSALQALSNAFADFDADGDLDLAVSFHDGAIRLYRNDAGTFGEAGLPLRLPTAGTAVRALAWGDFDGDGDFDLHAGVSREEGVAARNLLFRNDGAGRFVEVAEQVGVIVRDADSRQASWIDFDNDGDLDLFSAQRASTNRLFRNDGGKFTDVSAETGLADPRRTVGACWFDMDQDGDLDVFLANQESDKDALYRNDGGKFVDMAPQLGMHQPERTVAEGGVGCAVGDFDNDGLLDLFVATYGDALLYRNLGGGKFSEMAAAAGLRKHLHAVGASWADVDHDGDIDLFVAAYRPEDDWRSRDHLFLNEGGRFTDVLGDDSPLNASDHGVQWADVDRDGDLDLSLTEDFQENHGHSLFRNDLPTSDARRSLQVMARPGSEVRLYSAERRLLGTRLVPTGDGYGSQSAMPVHFGLTNDARVTVEVTLLTREGREARRLENVDPRKWRGKVLVVSSP